MNHPRPTDIPDRCSFVESSGELCGRTPAWHFLVRRPDTGDLAQLTACDYLAHFTAAKSAAPIVSMHRWTPDACGQPDTGWHVGRVGNINWDASRCVPLGAAA